MTAEKPLPNTDHVTRGCSRGYENDEVTASAFALREIEIRRGLLRISVDWVECAYAKGSERTQAASAERSRHRGARPPYALLAVSAIRQIKGQSDDPVPIVYQLDVKESGSCHCGITGYTNSSVDLQFQAELAEIANESPVTW